MIQWIAATFTAVGVWLLGDENKWGFAVASIGSLCWIVYSFYTSQWALLLLNGLFLGLDIRGLYNWTYSSTDDDHG